MPKKETTHKKRGRKPKGGKIIGADEIPNETSQVVKKNVILHLQCFLSDLAELRHNESNILAYDGNNTLFHKILPYSAVNYQSTQSKPQNTVNYVESFNNPSNHNDNDNDAEMDISQDTVSVKPTPDETKQLCSKLKELDKFLYHIQKNSDDINNIIAHETIEKMEQHSACFWCTCPFGTPSVYIPKHEVNGRYEVYGCFCTPECACAYLFEESIDQSIKWERYALLNYLYKNIFDNKKPFHPAPNPRYLLNKYFGTLSIDEYRSMLRSGQHMMVIDKPISKVYPEVHVDKHEFEELNGIVAKRKMRLTAPSHIKQRKEQSKNNILQNTFGNQ